MSGRAVHAPWTMAKCVRPQCPQRQRPPRRPRSAPRGAPAAPTYRWPGDRTGRRCGGLVRLSAVGRHALALTTAPAGSPPRATATYQRSAATTATTKASPWAMGRSVLRGAHSWALETSGDEQHQPAKDQTHAICAPYIRRSRRPAREQHTAASASCRVRNAARVSYPLHAWTAHT